MSAFLSGIGKALAIWPNTDYNSLIPKTNPTEEAWKATGQALTNSMLVFDKNICTEELNSVQKEALRAAREHLADYVVKQFYASRFSKEAEIHAYELIQDHGKVEELESNLKKVQERLTLLKELHEQK